jgi:hypothetical protein
MAALKADAHHWLTAPEYAALHLRLENAHAAVEARRGVRLDERKGRGNSRPDPALATLSQHRLIHAGGYKRAE